MIHLLHGAVGAPQDWDSLIPLLGDCAARAVDLYAGDISSFKRTAESLNQDALHGDVLVGYSMGGRLALHALTLANCPWSQAVIISSDPGSGPVPDRVARDRRWAKLARRDWDGFTTEWLAQSIFDGSPTPGDRAFPGARRVEAIARGFECWSVGRQEDLREELGRIELPVLWIVGERDQKFVDLAEGLVPRMPSGRLAVVRGAGHRVPWERPEVVADLIRSFIS